VLVAVHKSSPIPETVERKNSRREVQKIMGADKEGKQKSGL
jgi:hypothetical protein